jgi:ornithine carbamoyltransferase
MNLISLTELTPEKAYAIWDLADPPEQRLTGTVACSFESNGIQTRTTFIQAFHPLGLMYVVRESNHQRLAEFAEVSRRPVINAMSHAG